MDNNIFKILKASIYGGELDLSGDCDYESIFSELQSQTVLTLTKPVLYKLPLNDELHSKWEKAINQQLAKNARVAYEEKQICKLLKEAGVSFVIIKGSAAAQYYPKPELRSRGDIDILAQKGRFEKAAKVILDDNKFKEKKNPYSKKMSVGIKRNSVEIDLQSRFFEQDEQNAFIYSAIENLSFDKDIPMLPETENGIVFLYHIQFHLQSGIGLRQFIDWFMFVNTVLSDEFWHGSFKPYAEHFNLAVLAKAAAKLGVQLGLIERKITWCGDVDDELCTLLLEQIMRNGNFGQKENKVSRKVVTAFTSKLSPLHLMKILQAQGVANWPLAQQHAALKPLAGARQACIYIQRLANSGTAVEDIKRQKQESDKRQALLKKLGV